MRYILWCRRTNDPNAEWADMPYAARDYQSCVELQEIYEEQWGNHYIYEIHRAGRYGTTPQGPRQCGYVGIND